MARNGITADEMFPGDAGIDVPGDKRAGKKRGKRAIAGTLAILGAGGYFVYNSLGKSEPATPDKYPVAGIEAPSTPVSDPAVKPVRIHAEDKNVVEKKYFLDMSSQETFARSFAEALEAGERGVYAKGNKTGRNVELIQSYEGKKINQIEYINGDMFGASYKVFYDDGSSLVLWTIGPPGKITLQTALKGR